LKSPQLQQQLLQKSIADVESKFIVLFLFASFTSFFLLIVL